MDVASRRDLVVIDTFTSNQKNSVSTAGQQSPVLFNILMKKFEVL